MSSGVKMRKSKLKHTEYDDEFVDEFDFDNKSRAKNKKIIFSQDDLDEFNDDLNVKKFGTKYQGKWYNELKYVEEEESNKLSFEEIQKLKKQASFIFNDAVIQNKSKAPKTLSPSDYSWVKTVMSKGTKTDKVAAYTLLIQDSPLYNLNLLKNMVEMVKVGKKKECFMAVDTLCELFLNDLLPPNRKLMFFSEQPLSKLDELTSGNDVSKNRRLLLWYFEDQLKSLYNEFVSHLTKISYDSVEANKQKSISAMFKLLEGNSEMENVLLNNIVNKLGDPSRKVGSKTIYVLIKLLQTHPNMKEVVANAVEKVIFRNNISKRAQYYSICFLSQFYLSNDECLVAKKLVTIYLSLFKACVKTGEIDSRMMSALLAGVNRAFPYLKEEYALMQDHINTLYKIIHLSHANIAIQALSLVHLISNFSNSCEDRFYSVLYKKVGEIEMFQSTHHAMLINLIYKALKKDKEKNRVCAIIKRLFQVCAHIPVPVACGVLIMISQILKFKGDILLKESVPEITVKLEEGDDDDGAEHYKDVLEEDKLNVSVDLNKTKEEEEEEKDDKKPPANLFNVGVPGEMKIWSNPDKSAETAKAAEVKEYNPLARNPLYAGAQNILCYELFELVHHFHPTVALFAQKIVNGEIIKYSGDPFLDFTLIRFLDKFSFKNPKEIKPEEERNAHFAKFNRKKYYSSAPIRRLRANTAEYLKLNEKSIPVDEVFLYRYMKEKAEMRPLSKKEKDDSDLESVGSDEFDNLMTDILDGKKDEIDFRAEVGQLSKKEKNKKKGKTEGDDDDDDDDMLDENDDDDDDGDNNASDHSDGGSFAEDFDGDEIDDLSDVNDFGDTDLDEDEAELEASGFKLPDLSCLKGKSDKKKKKLGKKGFNKDSIFASAEEFAELLEEPSYNDGGSEALSNKDRAAVKQLKWESARDKWINKKSFRRKGVKRSHSGKTNKNVSKGVKKKRY